MPDKTYRVRVVKGDAEFEAEGDKTFVLDMLKRFQGLTGVSVGQKLTSRDRKSPLDAPRLTSPSRTLSAAEFIRNTDLKQHTDIVLAFGYYLDKHKELREFTPADINGLYYEAKMEPTNISMMCIRNIKKGLMMEPKVTRKSTKKRYMLTATGEKYVESHIGVSADES
jgi:hypothetical protein